MKGRSRPDVRLPGGREGAARRLGAGSRGRRAPRSDREEARCSVGRLDLASAGAARSGRTQQRLGMCDLTRRIRRRRSVWAWTRATEKETVA
jgi:hypothetical protein